MLIYDITVDTQIFHIDRIIEVLEILCEKRNLWGNELYEHWSTYVSVFLYPGKWAKFREKITYNSKEAWLNQCIFND